MKVNNFRWIKISLITCSTRSDDNTVSGIMKVYLKIIYYFRNFILIKNKNTVE